MVCPTSRVAHAEQIVLTEKISGVPVAVNQTPYVQAVGTKAGWLSKRLLRHPKGKHWMRSFYTRRSVWQLERASLEGSGYQQHFRAGKSVDGVERVEPAGTIVRRFAEAVRAPETSATAQWRGGSTVRRSVTGARRSHGSHRGRRPGRSGRTPGMNSLPPSFEEPS